ncbi:MAG TPA: hypothetical protein PKX92_03745 [Edaphocola sp.]|nr:hypothetical protein [Edaphocola sp.]
MIYTNASRGYDFSLEKYIYSFYDCEFDIAPDVPLCWIFMQTFNPSNVSITLRNRNLRLENSRASLRLTNNVTV